MTTNSLPTLLIVEDSPENRMLLIHLLKDSYRLKVAINGEQALEVVQLELPDLILLDIIMPGIDGYEVCRRLKAEPSTSKIPVIFLTAMTDVADEQLGFEVGAVDFILKPVSPPILLARVRNHLLLFQLLNNLKNQNDILDAKVKERTEELEHTQDAIILAMASLAETRDNDTGNHIRRTQHYVGRLATQLMHHPDFCQQLSLANIALLEKSAALHDIGKVGIPDAILLKPGKLDSAEFEVMKEHCRLGRDAILAAETVMGKESAFLCYAKEIAYSHQEKWDGSGYPLKLVGDQIPLSARLMALADVYDALRARRAYKPPMSHETAVKIIIEGKGTHFDPRVIDAFIVIQHEFEEIAEALKDALPDE